MTLHSTTQPILRVRNLSKSFGENRVLNGINLDIAAGEVLCLIGPSGSGKSTLLRTLATLDRPDGGVIFFNDVPLGLTLKNGRLLHLPEKRARQQRDKIGFVFQQFNLFPHLTALQNVTLAPSLTGGKDVRQRGLALLEKVGLAHKAGAYPGELSGGQQQRVAIARALARDPQLILFDEPTSALDPELVGEVLTTMAELAATGITMAIATHEMGFARRVANHIAFLDRGQIIEYGPPAQVLDNPLEARTREFLQQIHAH